MFEPRERDEQEHNENDHALFGGRETENAEQPLHLLA
jgi:hypothetical protein